MADRGPGPAALILKRIETEILRLEYQVQQQELQLMELDDQKRRIRDNIEASAKEIVRQQETLKVTREQYATEETNG